MSEAATRISLKVIPGSSRDCVAGWLENTLKVRVRAPAERGKANRSVEALIAIALGIARSDVRIVAGHISPRKTVEVIGLTSEQICEKLSKPSATH